jgi:uncharacterized phage protein (TIGR01671 family)
MTISTKNFLFISREIKFRGKSIETGNWIYGSLIVDSMTGKEAAIVDFADIDDGIQSFSLEKVYIETVGQYIGSNDKNGKEIYEGDILSQTFYEGSAPCCVIELRGGQFVGVNIDKSTRHIKDEYQNKNWLHWTIIGNIYENKELLK